MSLVTKGKKVAFSGKTTKKDTSASAKPTKKDSKHELLEEPEDEETEGEDEPQEVKSRKLRKKPTIEDHINDYDELFKLLDSEIDRKAREREKGSRALRTARMIVTKMRKDVCKVTRSKIVKQKSSMRKKTTSGLMKKSAITEELANFLKVPLDTRLSRTEVTSAICVYAHLKEDEKRESALVWKYLNPGCKRNLQLPQDKKALIPDKPLSKLLRYEEYKKNVAKGLITKNVKNKETDKKEVVKVTSNALYYYVIQRLLCVHFVKTKEMPVDQEEEDEDQEEDEEDEEDQEEDEEDQEENEDQEEDEDQEEEDEE